MDLNVLDLLKRMHLTIDDPKPEPLTADLLAELAVEKHGASTVVVSTHGYDLDPLVMRREEHGENGVALIARDFDTELVFKSLVGNVPLVERTGGRRMWMMNFKIMGNAAVGLVDARQNNTIGANDHLLHACTVVGRFSAVAVAVLGAEYCEYGHSHFRNEHPGGHGLWIATNARLKHDDAEPFVVSTTGLPLAQGTVSQVCFTMGMGSATVHGPGAVGIHIGRGVISAAFSNVTVSCNGGFAAFRIGDLGSGSEVPTENVDIFATIEGTPAKDQTHAMEYGVYVDGFVKDLKCQMRFKRGVVKVPFGCRKKTLLMGDVFPPIDRWVEGPSA